MDNVQSNPSFLPPPPDNPYILNGIHDGIYQQSKYYWNGVFSLPYDSLYFFAWCANNWLMYRGLHSLASSSNFGHLFERPYRYFQAMVVVGALTELQIYAYEWSSNDNAARFLIGFLFRMRNLAAAEWYEELVFNDSEEDYYAEAFGLSNL